jgi:hypothetical protein
MFSIRNLLFPLLVVLIYFLKDTPLKKSQIIIFAPLGLLFLYGTFSLFLSGSIDMEIIKDYFYFSFIPVLFLSIMLLANSFKEQFFESMARYAHYLLYFLFAWMMFELFTDIHLPVHTPNRFHIPSTFFTNANDLSVIVIQLFMIISVLKKRDEPQWRYTLAFFLSFIVVFITMSRLALLSFVIISIFIFLSKSYRWKDLIINVIVIGLTLTYLSFDLPNPRTSKSIIDRSKTRVILIKDIDYSSLESIDESSSDTFTQLTDENKDTTFSSSRIRFDIYSIPLRQPDKFIFGYGFNSDKEIITRYRTIPHKIINSHSFFIQLIFYFGWIGFILMVLFFGILGFYTLLHIKTRAFFIPVIITQALLLNVPSSVMRFPLVWIPFFIAIAYYTNLNNKHR